MADAPTFNYRGKTYAANRYALAPTGKVIQQGKRAAATLLRQGHALEVRAGIPTYVQAGGIPVEVQNGVQMVRSPLSRRMVQIGSRAYRNILAAGYEFHAAPAAGPADAPPGYLRLRVAVPDLALTGHGAIDAFNNAVIAFMAANPAAGYRVVLADGASRLVAPQNVGGGIVPRDVLRTLMAMAGLGSERASWEDVYDAVLRGGGELARLMAGARLMPSAEAAVPESVRLAAELYAADGDGDCVRTALAAWRPDYDWSWVPDHCGPEDMAAVAERGECTIKVWSQARDEPLVYAPRDNNRKGRVCHLWHQFHHVILLGRPPAQHFADERAATTRIELVVGDDERGREGPALDKARREALQRRLAEVARTEAVKIKNFDGQLAGFITADAVYKLNFDAARSYPTAWTNTGAARQAAGWQDPHQAARFVGLRASEIVTPALTYQPGTAGQREGEVTIEGYEWDIRGAYRTTHLSPHFMGYPEPGAPHEWVEWDPAFLAPATGVAGLAHVRTELDFPATVFDRREMLAPFPLVAKALARGEAFTIGGCYVTARTDSDVLARAKERMAEFFVEKPAVSALIGRCWKSQANVVTPATTLAEANALRARGLHELPPIRLGDTAAVYMFQELTPKPIDREYPDLVQYIHAYTKLAIFSDVIERLPEIGMGFDNIRRIWCDGVTLDRPLPAGFLNPRVWAPKGDGQPLSRTFSVVPLTTAPARLDLPAAPVPFNPAALRRLVALLGPPGSGKTHAILNQWAPGRALLLSATTRCAAAALGAGATTVQKVLERAGKSPAELRVVQGYDRLVVDEFTMLTLAQLKDLVKLGVPLLLSGDFAQLSAVCPAGGSDQPITREALEVLGFHVIDLPDGQNRRAADDATRALYRAVREAATTEAMAAAALAAGVRRAAAVAYPAAGERAHYVAAHNGTVNARNAEYCRLIAAPDAPAVDWGCLEGKRRDTRLRAPFTPGMLLIGVRSADGAIDNQELVTAVSYVRAQGRRGAQVTFRRASGELASAPPSHLNPGYAITFHRLQGQTLDCPLAVDLQGIFEPAMLYVAVTRVRSLAQLTFVGE